MANQFKWGPVRAYANQLRISRYAANVDLARTIETADVTVQEDNDKRFIATLRQGGFKFDGIADGTLSTAGSTVGAGGWQQVLANTLGSTAGPSVWSVGMMGSTAGARAYMFQTHLVNHDFSAPTAGRVGVMIGCQPSSKMNFGRFQLNGLTTQTATVIGSTVTWLSTKTSTGGGYAHYHVTDVTTAGGSTISAFKVVMQHSSGGAFAWTDITGTSSTFAAPFNPAFARRTATNLSIKRFTRANITAFAGGAGKKINVAVAFARSSL